MDSIHHSTETHIMAQTPKEGQTYLHTDSAGCKSPYIIRKVYTFGTLDIEDQKTGEWFRVTGLPFIKKD